MDWEECCKKRIAKEVSLDESLIFSLKKTSENKLKSSNELVMNEVNASSKVVLAYDSLRELLEALSLSKGYKIYNHECYACFLREIIKESNKADEFDDIRTIRNNLNYYGKEVSVKEAEEIIRRIVNLRKLVFSMLS